MQIILKGIQVPKGCGKCHFCDGEWGNPRCHAKSRQGRNIPKTYMIDDVRPDWCPAEPDPEQELGEWINVKRNGTAECNRCGTSGNVWMKYCHNCGIKMKEEPQCEPTERQVRYAEYLAQRMCQKLPEEHTKKAYAEFISKWKPAVQAEDAGMNEPDAWQLRY